MYDHPGALADSYQAKWSYSKADYSMVGSNLCYKSYTYPTTDYDSVVTGCMKNLISEKEAYDYTYDYCDSVCEHYTQVSALIFWFSEIFFEF